MTHVNNEFLESEDEEVATEGSEDLLNNDEITSADLARAEAQRIEEEASGRGALFRGTQTPQ